MLVSWMQVSVTLWECNRPPIFAQPPGIAFMIPSTFLLYTAH